jgi:uncharacterized protein YqgC (DUF456 family)
MSAPPALNCSCKWNLGAGQRFKAQYDDAEMVMALFGNMVGAVAGRALARTMGGVAAGPAGAIIGVALPFVARRLGPMGMVGLAIGAWAVNRLMRDAADTSSDTGATPMKTVRAVERKS